MEEQMALQFQKLNAEELFNDIQSINRDRTQFVVLIGENGVGKSTLLAQFAEHLVHSEYCGPIVAISNTPHDKFLSPANGIQYLGQREGSRYAVKAIKEALNAPRNNVAGKVRKLAEILQLMGYDRSIGLALQNFRQVEIFSETDRDLELTSVIDKVSSTVSDKQSGTNTPIVWLNLDDHDESKTGASFAPRLLRNEEALIKVGALEAIRIILRKNSVNRQNLVKEIDLEAASSGEITYLSTMAWASTKSAENCVLLIDEPENSLHPKWQVKYIENLHNLFRYEHPLVVIASHSPLLLTGEDPKEYDILPYKIEEGPFALPIDTANDGLEGVSWSAFGVLSSNNQYLSGFLIDLLNQVCRDEIEFKSALKTIDELLNACTDENQIQVINTFKAALKIAVDEKNQK